MVSDATTTFFEALGSREREPLLQRASGTVRFELRDGETIDRWRVTMTGETVEVRHRGGAADCVVRADRAVFDRIVLGRSNAMAALLRGVMIVEGDPTSLVLLQRLFPGPPPTAGHPKLRHAEDRP
jgi:putative sterol carrier protein